jgi:hypothetical protein
MVMTKRMQVREHVTLDCFMPPHHPMLVACERCKNCATLLKFVFPRTAKAASRRMGQCSCLHCGHQWMATAEADFFSDGPLWLQARCHGNVLWVLNRPHLDFLEEFIAAGLREERMQDRSTRRLSSALPGWMLAGKNREDVVRALKQLRRKLEATTLGK